VTPTQANSPEVGLGEGESASVCGTETTTVGELIPDTGARRTLPLQVPVG
jgi:hypothetical protein